MIGTYEGLKGYISQYVLGDPRIADGGLLWGESKRTLDAMSSEQIYPYFWVEDFRFLASESSQHQEIYVGWQLDISIKANALYGEILEEESALKLTHHILYDFIAFLNSEHQDQRIYFDFKRFKAYTTTGDEKDNAWGWSCSLIIGEWPDEFCPPDEQSRHEVLVFQPVFIEEEADLEIIINEEPYTTVWDDEKQRMSVIQNIVDEINLTETALKAWTDGCFLYLIAIDLTDTIIVTFGPGHEWLEPFKEEL